MLCSDSCTELQCDTECLAASMSHALRSGMSLLGELINGAIKIANETEQATTSSTSFATSYSTSARVSASSRIAQFRKHIREKYLRKSADRY